MMPCLHHAGPSGASRARLWMVLRSGCAVLALLLLPAITVRAHRRILRFGVNTSEAFKDVTFIRHAESVGNKARRRPLNYLFTGRGALFAYRDGQLTEEGEAEAVSRVKALEPKLLQGILSAELALVSPLARAMATLIVVLAAAYKEAKVDPAAPQRRELKVRVVAELREKISSLSDQPGTGLEDPRTYLTEVSRRYGSEYFGDPDALKHVLDSLIQSYNHEEERTHHWGRHVEHHHTRDDAGDVLERIQHFRSLLRQEPSRHVLMVGHSSWSRWNFAVGMRRPRHENDALRRVVFGGTTVCGLNNMGIVTARFSSSDAAFHDVRVEDTHTCHEKLALYASVPEAREAGLVPKDAEIHRFMMQKTIDHGGSQLRMVTLSAFGSGAAYLAWADELGKPKKYIDLSWWNVKLEFEDASATVRLHARHCETLGAFSHEGGAIKVNPFILKARSEDEYRGFSALARKCVRLANEHLVERIRSEAADNSEAMS